MDKYHSTFAKFLGVLHRNPLYAITVSSKTTWYSCGPEKISVSWRAHEDCHKAQIAKEGWFHFMRTYLWDNFVHGYGKNKDEVAARLAAAAAENKTSQ